LKIWWCLNPLLKRLHQQPAKACPALELFQIVCHHWVDQYHRRLLHANLLLFLLVVRRFLWWIVVVIAIVMGVLRVTTSSQYASVNLHPRQHQHRHCHKKDWEANENAYPVQSSTRSSLELLLAQ
jgi:hypothetical protein